MPTDERRHELRRKPGDQPVTNDDLYEALALHATEEREYVRSLIEGVMRAFPSGPENHRTFHQERDKAAKAEEEFWRTAKEQLIKAGVNGIVTLVKVIVLLVALGLTVKFTLPDALAKLVVGAFGK
jgi:hypothetical protein